MKKLLIAFNCLLALFVFLPITWGSFKLPLWQCVLIALGFATLVLSVICLAFRVPRTLRIGTLILNAVLALEGAAGSIALLLPWVPHPPLGLGVGLAACVLIYVLPGSLNFLALRANPALQPT